MSASRSRFPRELSPRRGAMEGPTVHGFLDFRAMLSFSSPSIRFFVAGQLCVARLCSVNRSFPRACWSDGTTFSGWHRKLTWD